MPKTRPNRLNFTPGIMKGANGRGEIEGFRVTIPDEEARYLGFVYDTSGAGWTATHAGNEKKLTVPGFYDREWAGWFLYDFARPNRASYIPNHFDFDPDLLPQYGELYSLSPMKGSEDFHVERNSRSHGVGMGYLQKRDDGRYDVRAGFKSIGIVTDPWVGLWKVIEQETQSTLYQKSLAKFEPHEDVTTGPVCTCCTDNECECKGLKIKFVR